MSDEPTSVRPELLQQFRTTSRALESHLDARIQQARGAVDAFLAGTDGRLASTNPSLMGRGLSDLTERLADTRRFAELLRQAVLAADVSSVDGVATLSSAQLMAALGPAARSEFEVLLRPDPPPPIHPPSVGTIPQTSGFVDDPVCTATGHFLEDELDLVVPERLAQLGWPRRYSSRQLDVGGHGPGWWTWAEAACRAVDDEVVLVCPDGRHVHFPRPTPGQPVGADGDDVTLEVTSDGRCTVRWGVRARSGPETWHFDADGRPTLVEAALGGRTHLDHDDAGRLVAMRHEGGRSVHLDWDDERIVALHDGHGRGVRYRYHDGHLVEVQRPAGGRTYATDDHARIVEVVDADGVTLARNRYDADGRVVRQVAPTGRVTVFRYEPGRRTAVLDGAGDLIALFVHDHRGRVEALVSPHGAEVSRRFDGDGVVVSQVAGDGSGFTTEGHAGPDGVLKIDHHDGRSEQVHHDHLGRVVRHDVRGAGSVHFEYEGDSICPSAIVSPSGARRTMSWQDGGVLVGLTDPDGVAFAFEVDGDGLVTAASDAAGRTARSVRHVTGLPSRIVLPDGGHVDADVDDGGRVVRVVAADGATSHLEYSPAGRLTALVAADGARTELHHGVHGFIESVTGPDGSREHVEIDEWGRPTAIGAGGDAPGWTLRWSPLGVLTEVTTPGGARWQHELDAHHQVSAVIDPSERTTVVGRDHTGRVDEVRSPAGTERIERDVAGRVAAVDSVPGGRVELDHDDEGRVTAQRDADGVSVRTAYTPGGRTAAVQVGGDEPVTFDHDEAGNVSAVHRAGSTWRVVHDWRGALTSLTGPDGSVLRIERDPQGRPVVVDRAGRVERYAYDARGRLAGWTRPSGATTTVVHDVLGRIVGVDGPGGEMRFDHDLDAGTTVATDPFGGRTRSEVDAAGRLVRRTDQLGRSTAMEHDADGAPRAVVHPDGTRLGFEHDDAGRTTAVFGDGTALARYRYEDGVLAEVDEPVAGRRTAFETTAAGRVAAWTDAAGRVAVTRDDAGRVVRRRGGGLPEADWTHAHDGWRGRVGDHDVAVTTDADGALRAVSVAEQAMRIERDGTGEVGALERTADDVAARVALERDGAGRIVAAHVDGVTTRYGYDDADRLASRRTDDGSVAWRHDVAGRPVAEIRTDDAGTAERRFDYDAAHQLVAVHGPEGTTRLDYDPAGRRVAEHRPDGTTRRYEWDALGRLTAVVDGDRRTEVDVDSFGRLRRVGATELRWDLSAPVPELAAIGERPVVSAGRLVLAVDGQVLPASVLGPAVTGTHPWGTAPAGEEVSADCGIPGGIGFAGLVWLGDRVLDPATGQFLSPDPQAAVLGSPTQAFPYGYADGDPINRADPTGRSGQPISIQDFEKMRDHATSAWKLGNIATVVGTAAMIGLAFVPGVNIVAFAAAGAIVGGLQAAGSDFQRDGNVGLGNVVLGTVLGGATTFLGAAGSRYVSGLLGRGMSTTATAGSRTLSTVARDVSTNAAISAAVDFPLHLAHEGITSAYEGRGYDFGTVVQGTMLSGLSGGATTYAPSPTWPSDVPTPPTQPSTPAPPSSTPQPALPAPAPQAALPAPAPQPALPAGPVRPALPAGPVPPALPAGPSASTSTSSLLTPTASLSLPQPPAGFVAHSSGLYVPQ
jgi:RHS repeat-associated protein